MIESDVTDQEIAISIMARQSYFAKTYIEGFEYVLRKDTINEDYHMFLNVKGDSIDRKGIVEGFLILVANRCLTG